MTGKYTHEPVCPEMTGAEIVLQALRDNGVEHIFGYPGASVLPIYDEIFKQGDITHILVRHEQGAGHAAEGYARSTGKAGVMLVTSGPGVTNSVTSLQNAMMHSVPLICLSGQVATTLIGSDAFQECDTVGITRQCTKYNCLVTDINELAAAIHKAFQVAISGQPGPVLVDMPKDILVQSAQYTAPSAIAHHKRSIPQTTGCGQQWLAPDNIADEMDGTNSVTRYALSRLYELTRDHAPYFTTDMVQLQAAEFDDVEHGNRWIASSRFGTMGYGLPAAIGVQIAHPGRLVINIANESSVQSTMKELSTAIQYKTPIKLFIVNNGHMGVVGYSRQFRHENHLAHSYSQTRPDFVKLAAAFGAIGIRCDASGDLDDAIREMITVNQPVLFDFDCRVTAGPSVNPGRSFHGLIGPAGQTPV